MNINQDKFLSKLRIKDYNNELEKILENKVFSHDTKNLLLSMLYKIENSYTDYEKVKREVISKNDFIESIIKTIDENCNDIEIVKPHTISSKKLEEENVQYIIDKEKLKIYSYERETAILSAIIQMKQEDLENVSEDSCEFLAIKQMLKMGELDSKVEAIRDFNGWSWDIVPKEIKDIKYNIIYQNLLLLVGNTFLIEWLQNWNKEKYIKIFRTKLEKLYGKENTNKFLNVFYKSIIELFAYNNEGEKQKLLEVKKNITERLELLKNKKAFVEKITQEKKQYNIEIKKIDKLLSNAENLREEYIKRNKSLPDKEKIFSMSHLSDRLEKEREELLEKIKHANKLIEPKEFVKEKEKIEKQAEFIGQINLENELTSEKIINLNKLCLESINSRIEKIEDKNEIIEWLYKLRYYNYLSINENEIIATSEQLQSLLEKNKEILIQKACEQKVFETISPDSELNKKVLKEVFTTKMIDLDNMVIQCKYEKGTLIISYYDTTILENTIEFKVSDVKIRKKIKLFI